MSDIKQQLKIIEKEKEKKICILYYKYLNIIDNKEYTNTELINIVKPIHNVNTKTVIKFLKQFYFVKKIIKKVNKKTIMIVTMNKKYCNNC
jgi:hypothetical protein